MKKKDLKTGMYVKLRDDSICIVQKEQELLVDVKSGGYVELISYNDDLITGCDIIHSLDIIVVYDDYKMEKIIWERPKELLTKEEKEWLQAVIKPCKDKVAYIIAFKAGIDIKLKSGDNMALPYYHNLPFKFEHLERDKEYTLKELGLED